MTEISRPRDEFFQKRSNILDGRRKTGFQGLKNEMGKCESQQLFQISNRVCMCVCMWVCEREWEWETFRISAATTHPGLPYQQHNPEPRAEKCQRPDEEPQTQEPQDGVDYSVHRGYCSCCWCCCLRRLLLCGSMPHRTEVKKNAAENYFVVDYY
jgi:hypothetical protein